MARTSPETLRTFYKNLAAALGAPEAEADIFSRCILRADLRGKYTQGGAIVPYLASLVEEGLARFEAEWTMVSDTGAARVVDGGRGVGPVVAWQAMESAMERARRHGLATVWVRNGGDYAMASNHVLQAVDAGLVGITIRNGNPRVAPWGGTQPAFGTDPIAVGIPAGAHPPVVVDMAAGSYSVGQVIMAARDGRRMPEALLAGRAGRYTDDPVDLVADPADRESAFTGAIVSQGYRGFAWLLIAELMTGLLAGTGPSLDNAFEPNVERPWNEATFFMALDPAVLLPDADFTAQVDRMCEALSAMQPAEGFDRVRIPGWEAHGTEQAYRRDGIPLRAEVRAALNELGARYGLRIE